MAPRLDLLQANARAMQWLEDVPPVLREDPDLQAIYYCSAKEAERLEARIEDVRAQLNPLTATEAGLAIWEPLIRLAAAPGGTVETRRTAVVGRIRSLAGDPSGRDWIRRVDAIVGLPWTYEEHIPGDGTTPPAQVLRIFLPWAASNPSWAQAVRLIREETPPELGIQYVSSEGFLLDVSHMDVDAFGI